MTQTIVEDTPEEHGGWRRAEKLLLAAVVLFCLNLFLLGLTEIQIQSRENTLDNLEESVTLIREDAKAIRTVSDRFANSSSSGNSETAQAFIRLVESVAAIEQKVCGGPCPEPPKEG